MWNAFNQALTLIAKTSVNAYYAIPREKVLVCRPLRKAQIRWLQFALVYLLVNSLACLAKLSSLRRINQTSITENIVDLMFTLLILALICVASGSCWVLTFNPSGLSSILNDMRSLQKITSGNKVNRFTFHSNN